MSCAQSRGRGAGPSPSICVDGERVGRGTAARVGVIGSALKRSGRLAQMVRAAGLQPAGRGFESLSAHRSCRILEFSTFRLIGSCGSRSGISARFRWSRRGHVIGFGGAPGATVLQAVLALAAWPRRRLSDHDVSGICLVHPDGWCPSEIVEDPTRQREKPTCACAIARLTASTTDPGAAVLSDSSPSGTSRTPSCAQIDNECWLPTERHRTPSRSDGNSQTTSRHPRRKMRPLATGVNATAFGRHPPAVGSGASGQSAGVLDYDAVKGFSNLSGPRLDSFPPPHERR